MTTMANGLAPPGGVLTLRRIGCISTLGTLHTLLPVHQNLLYVAPSPRHLNQKFQGGLHLRPPHINQKYSLWGPWCLFIFARGSFNEVLP